MEKIYTRDMPWEAYPKGTKVFAVLGGHWEKTERGWKWCTGATFSTPGGDWHHIVMPYESQEQDESGQGDKHD